MCSSQIELPEDRAEQSEELVPRVPTAHCCYSLRGLVHRCYSFRGLVHHRYSFRGLVHCCQGREPAQHGAGAELRACILTLSSQAETLWAACGTKATTNPTKPYLPTLP